MSIEFIPQLLIHEYYQQYFLLCTDLFKFGLNTKKSKNKRNEYNYRWRTT